ncbi:hypothetical protein ACH4GK_31975 [Streptomyces rimosus]|uniref:hypothetical protein n=1 Tax=Streptomyces rimosus TaxID=1927 RepID=UPI0004CB554E|nr:hypothetical protein [Streptomyces rimosus]
MTDTLDAAIADVVGALDAIADPVERYQAMPSVKTKVDDALRGVRQRIALELHGQGKPWREVGQLMGNVSAQRAWQMSRGE